MTRGARGKTGVVYMCNDCFHMVMGNKKETPIECPICSMAMELCGQYFEKETEGVELLK